MFEVKEISRMVLPVLVCSMNIKCSHQVGFALFSLIQEVKK